MQAIYDFFRQCLSWYNGFIAGESPLSIISFWVGVISLIVGVFATVYAYQSAIRTDRLLKRLVIYPFRGLDLAISRLTPVQREELLQLYRVVHNKRSFQLSDASRLLGQFAQATLDLLMEEGWLIRKDEGEARFVINPDRQAYLAFFVEASQDSSDKKR